MPLSWKILKLKTLTILFLASVSSVWGETEVRDGFLYLNDEDRAYHLVGKWKYKKESNPKRQPDPSSGAWKDITVPGIWSNLGIESASTIWYKLEFRVYKSLLNRDLGLMIPNTAFAHEVYLNGKLLNRIGSFAEDGSVQRKSNQSSFTGLPRSLILPKGKNTIMIRVGGYAGVGGFNQGDIYIGKKDLIQEKFLRNLLWNTTMFAIFLFVGFYHLVIYSARKKDSDYLYYSLMCFMLAVYILCFTTLSYWVIDNFWFYYFGVILSVNLLPIFLVRFFHKFLESKVGYLGRMIVISSIFFILVGFFLNLSSPENFYRFNTIVLKMILSLLGISLIYPLYFIFLGIRQNKIGSYLVLVGYCIFAIACVNDILIYLSVYKFYKFVELGFFAFIMSISFAMALKFANVHRELEYLTQNLSEEVRRRTSQLQESNQRLIEMDKLKTSFFANVTHELRTPLTLSLVPIEKLLRELDSPNHIQLLDTAHRNNIKLLKLINDLLDFAKIESGLMALRLAPTNLSRLMEGLISHFRMNAEAKGLEVISEIEPNLTSILDPEKVEKIVTNLITNSYKFTESGGKIWIQVSRVKHSDSKNYIMILVGDSGIGIPEDRLEYIFERFHQVDMRRERVYEGSGIGLSLVKELTELHKGFVEVTSREGEGSEFRIYLPIHEKSLVLNSPSHPPTETDPLPGKEDNTLGEMGNPIPEEENLPSFSQQVLNSLIIQAPKKEPVFHSNHSKILIVEDNPEMVFLLEDLLEKDYDLVIAKDGFQGLEKAGNMRPDLIISDVMMPGMNGFELTKSIREDIILKQTPIILLTAMNDLDGKLEGFTTGVDDYISKPFQPLELKARINNLIQKSNLQREKNLRLNQLQKELILARDIQSQLLPQNLPDIPNLSIASMYIPLDEVGGDFYDMYWEGDFLFIFMCDVSGHGVPACLIASMVKMALQSEISEKKNEDVNHILEGINKSLVNIIGNNFVTASLSKLNLPTGDITSATAGHPPIYHIQQGKTLEIQSRGKPLGLFQNFETGTHITQLQKQDTLFFYTDGIVESVNPQGEFYGEERLTEFLESHSNLEADELIDSLSQELTGFRGNAKFDDDITGLAIKIHSVKTP